MKHYHLNPDEAAELDGAQGWVYYNFAIENEASVWGSGIERKTDGYVKQETKKILVSMTRE